MLKCPRAKDDFPLRVGNIEKKIHLFKEKVEHSECQQIYFCAVEGHVHKQK